MRFRYLACLRMIGLSIGLSATPGWAAEIADADANPREYLADPTPEIRPALPKTSHNGVLSSGPNCGVTAYTGGNHSVWLGHFSGGDIGPAGVAAGDVNWKTVYACFKSRNDCEAWQHSMKSVYAALDGYRSCQLIR